MSVGSWAALALTPVLLTACATYQREPLPQQPDLLRRIPALEVDARLLRIPGITSRVFDASDGLDMTETVILAVVNAPDLKAARLQRGIGQAQLLQAGLLPDPVMSIGLDHPTAGGPGLVNAFNLGINQDLRALITRSSARSAARSQVRKVDLDILWQEWQVAQKARELYVQLQMQRHLHVIYAAARALYARRYARDREALRFGVITLDVSAGDLVNLVNASTRLRKLEQDENSSRHELNVLLGLRPQFPLKLAGSPAIRSYTEREVRAASADLLHRRPDLVALQAGYASQEAAVRQAVLEQFPAVNVGITRARDTSDVYTIGLGISIGLPIFNANRGHIAIERATRARLRAEFQARLDQTVSEADRVWREGQILQRQLREVRARIPELRSVARRAERGLQAGNLSAGTYINLETQLLDNRAEAVQLEGSLQRSRIALETLLGMPLSAHNRPQRGAKTR